MTPLLLPNFLDHWAWASLDLPDPRPRARFIDLGLAFLCAPPPVTLTSALEWLRRTQVDWSEDYRLFAQTHWQAADLFAHVFQAALPTCGSAPARVYLATDDTLCRKTGKKIPGVGYARDPLSPPFQVNLVRGQRFVQTSILCRPRGPQHPWRALPVQFSHAPTPQIPRSASPELQAQLKAERKKRRLSLVALEQLRFCRRQLDRSPGGKQIGLCDLADGSYANGTFLRGLPERTHAVVRLRKDAHLRAYLPPDQRRGARKYGDPLPTPWEYLQDPRLPWQPASLFIAGQMRTLQFKEKPQICWPRGTGPQPVRLILIKAAGYRLAQGSKLLYREPAFLLTTEPTTPAVELIGAYVGRWEIEVNFRDEKTLVGVGQGQVRRPLSVERLPQFQVAAYAMLLLGSIQVYGDQRGEAFEALPAWRNQKPLRPSTRDLLRRLRKEAADYPTQRERLNPWVKT